MLLAVEVEPPQVSNYGVFDVEATDDDRVKKVVGMVEKPAVESAPSDVVATGRYLLGCAIFGALRHITPGKSGELQLTGAIALLISEGHPAHYPQQEAGSRQNHASNAGVTARELQQT